MFDIPFITYGFVPAIQNERALAFLGLGADPGFWERGGLINKFTTGGGMPPPMTARGSGPVWGSADSPTSAWGLGLRPSRFFAFAFI